jgi:hypothetical protein
VDEPQVSWLVIEPGWTVVAADGSDVGYVQEVIGDDTEDVFDGLAISTSLFEDLKYVPSEKVGRIFDGRIELLVASNDVSQLGAFLEPPPSLEIDSSKPVWSDRVLEEVAPVHTTAEAVPFWKRLRAWFASVVRR